MLEPEHRRAVRARLASLLGQKLDRVGPHVALVTLARGPWQLGQVVQRLQQDFGVTLDRRALAAARTVDHLVTLVSEAARQPGPGAVVPATRPGRSDVEPDGGSAGATPARAPRGETFTSSVGFESERIHAVALYCSDGRIGDHVDDFLHNGLGLPRYDRLACPGGPAALAGRLPAFWECRGVEDQLRFLLRFHAVQQVVLIAHQPCAYYEKRLLVAPATLETQQQEDLRRATWTVQRADPTVAVAGFIAWVEGEAVHFERLLGTDPLEERIPRRGGSPRTTP